MITLTKANFDEAAPEWPSARVACGTVRRGASVTTRTPSTASVEASCAGCGGGSVACSNARPNTRLETGED